MNVNVSLATDGKNIPDLRSLISFSCASGKHVLKWMQLLPVHNYILRKRYQRWERRSAIFLSSVARLMNVCYSYVQLAEKRTHSYNTLKRGDAFVDEWFRCCFRMATRGFLNWLNLLLITSFCRWKHTRNQTQSNVAHEND